MQVTLIALLLVATRRLSTSRTATHVLCPFLDRAHFFVFRHFPVILERRAKAVVIAPRLFKKRAVVFFLHFSLGLKGGRLKYAYQAAE